MPKLLLHRCVAVAFVSAAIGAVIVIAPLPVTIAHAAAAPSVVASALCHGDVANSPSDSTDLPVGDLNMNMGFLTPGVSPAKKPPDKVNGLFSLAINAKCAGIAGGTSQNPCVWAGSFTGAEERNGNMTLTFGDLPAPSTLGPDILDGCQTTFLVMPYSKNASAAFIATSLLTQAPAPAPTCKPAGTQFVVSCTLNNN